MITPNVMAPIRSAAYKKQQGAVLVVALMLLLVMTVLVVALARTQTSQERIAQNDQNSQIGMQAAEATLRWVESGLAQGLYTNFTAGNPGLFQLDPSNPTNILTLPDASKLSYAGPTLSGSVNLSSTPKYIIEQMPPVATPGRSATSCQYGNCGPSNLYYRVTAYSSGADSSSQTILQSVYKPY